MYKLEVKNGQVIVQNFQEKYPNLKSGNMINLGRKSKYRPEYDAMVIEHMKKGYSFESFGAIVHVAKQTIYTWMKEHPSFMDAVQEGVTQSLLFWEAMGIQGTAGKLKGFNSSAYALNMANKHKWISGRQDMTSDGEKIEAPIVYIPREDRK